MLLPLYYILAVLMYILALPFLLFASLKKKYKLSIAARFFLYKNSSFTNENRVWFHACSLGEINSLKVIIEHLEGSVNVSAITATGYNSAKQIKNADVRFLPYEIFLPFWIKKQKVLIVTEAELWPFLFIFSKKRGTKTILLNARISDNSYKSYKRFAFLYKWIFSHIDKVFAQSEKDKQRLLELGAKDVIVNGNIKTISVPVCTKEYKKPIKEVITFASTHEGEEELLLNKLTLKNNQMLVVVPRHPERFNKVNEILANYVKKNSLTYSRLSENESFNTDVVLCDKMGELINIYAISDITYLCGSFKDKIGGHNPLESAFFKNKIISGEFFFNQKPLYKLTDGIKICSVDELDKINYEQIKASEVKYKGEISSLLNEING